MNDATDMKLAAGVALACDRIFNKDHRRHGYNDSIEKSLPHNSRDLIAFMDAHKVYMEFPDGGFITFEKGAFRAKRGKELGETDTEDGEVVYLGFSTLDDALHAYAEDVVLKGAK